MNVVLVTVLIQKSKLSYIKKKKINFLYGCNTLLIIILINYRSFKHLHKIGDKFVLLYARLVYQTMLTATLHNPADSLDA